MKRNLLILTILLVFAHSILIGQSRFTPEQLTEDLVFYKTRLEKYHPNLYLYSSKEDIDHFFDSLIQSINIPLTETEFYQKITLSSSLVKDGHTLILPGTGFIGYHNLNSKFLPLQIGIFNEQLYVKMNYTQSIFIEEGTIINSINGLPSTEILKSLMDTQVRDGDNTSYANWILDTYFREYYSYSFGHPDIYEISYTRDNLSYTVQIPALSKDSIAYYRQNNYPLVYLNSTKSKGIYLEYDSNYNAAILTIKDFHSDILKNIYKQNFKKEIEPIFDSISSLKVENLIIDLRDNQGGSITYGIMLLSHLIQQQFKVVNAYYRLRNGELVKTNGPSSGFHKPNKNPFTGQIYVITNGGSFSNSVIVSSCLKEHTNALFIGTESGGNPNILSAFTKDFELPNTKIRVEIPTKQFIMTSTMRNNGKGLIPNYIIENNIQDNVSQYDRQFNFVMMLINENNNNSK